MEEQRGGPQTKSPESNVPTTKGADTRQAQSAAKWDVSLVQEGECVHGREGAGN